MIGHGERQLGDDHIGQRLARHVDALPEAIGSKQHAARIATERVQQLRPVLRLRLGCKVADHARPAIRSAIGAAPQQIVAGEQHEGVTVGVSNKAFDLIGNRFFELVSLTRGIGKITHDD